MKKIKNWAIAIAFILLIGIIIWLSMKNKKITAISQLQAVELSVLNDSVAIYKAKNGELTYKLNTTEVDNSSLKEALEIAGYDIKQLKAKDIEWRNIVSTLKLQVESLGHGSVNIHDTLIISTRDTIKFSTFDWSNNFLSLQGNIKEQLGIKTMKFDYKYQTSINIIQAQQRKSTIISVYLSDPNAYITTGNSITITNPRKWWDRWWVFGAAGLLTGVLIMK
jgi:hypothetical protein